MKVFVFSKEMVNAVNKFIEEVNGVISTTNVKAENVWLNVLGGSLFELEVKSDDGKIKASRKLKINQYNNAFEKEKINITLLT